MNDNPNTKLLQNNIYILIKNLLGILRYYTKASTFADVYNIQF